MIVPTKIWVTAIALVGVAGLFAAWLNGERKEAAAEAVAEFKIAEAQEELELAIADYEGRMATLQAEKDSLEQAVQEVEVRVVEYRERTSEWAGVADSTGQALEDHLESVNDTTGLRLWAVHEAADTGREASWTGLLIQKDRLLELERARTANAQAERDEERRLRVAAENANRALAEQIGVLQRQAHPGFFEGIVDDLPTIAVTAGATVLVCNLVDKC